MIDMDEFNLIGNEKYQKAVNWSSRKLEKALDEEAQGATITKSTIKKMELEINNLLAKSSELIGANINADNINEYIEKIQNNVILVQLKVNESEIQLLVNRLTQARHRLQDHSTCKSYLLDLLKRKNQ